MRNVIFAIATVGLLAGCSAAERGATVGGVAGAAIGGASTNSVAGAAVGGIVGATAGALIGRASSPGDCVYEDRRGRQYIAPC